MKLNTIKKSHLKGDGIADRITDRSVTKCLLSPTKELKLQQ